MLTSLRVLAAFFATLLAPPIAAQSVLEGTFDPSIPTLEAEVGHATGSQITAPHEIVDYLEALHEAAPERTRLVQYATSWEGRPLHYLVISSAANMARVDANKAAMDAIASGAAPPAGTLPVTWLSYGVHGNEISSSDAALALAYHLLAARGDARTDAILANSYVVIDPSQNPDGRNRFVTGFRTALGLEPNADRYSAEHDEPWPAGRTNHYLFDLNRDWFALTQPETRGKVAALLEWNPVVFVDAHEMSGDDTYYFPPAAEPFNPNITAAQKEKSILLGRAIARDFDALGIPYFTREIFDAFYPGYGDTWPTLQGAIGATFEQASSRGLLWERSDGDVLTYGEGVRNHFLASLAYAETVARNADRFLNDYSTYRRSASEGARGTYLIDLSQRRWNAEALARRLAAQGIDVKRIAPGYAACGKRYTQGALAIDRAQPEGRLIRSLLDRDTALDPAFVRKQEERRERGQDHELYDTTAWSVGLMSGLDVALCTSSAGAGTDIEADAPIAAREDGSATFGYAIPWTDTGQAQLVMAALRDGIDARSSNKAFTSGGREFPRGTVIVPRRQNGEDAMARLTGLTREIGAEIVGLADSWVDSGPNYGSDNFARLEAPRVAMAWDKGISPTSAGSLRYVIERRLATPVVPIRTGTLARANLSAYDALVVPEGSLDEGARKAVQDYVRGGGTAIIVGEAMLGFTKKETRLFATAPQNALGEAIQEDEEDEGAAKDKEAGKKAKAIADEAAYEELIADPDALPDILPGALVRTVADTEHVLTSGYDRGPVVSASGNLVLTPLNRKDGVNVLRFAKADDLLESGHIWDENRRQMAFTPYLIAQRNGEGLAIGFAHDPSQRGYLDGLDLLIANAILLAPAHMR